jgi:hypothetical protein
MAWGLAYISVHRKFPLAGSEPNSYYYPRCWKYSQVLSILSFEGYAVFPGFKGMNVRPSLRRALGNLRVSSASRFSKDYKLRGAWDKTMFRIQCSECN